MMSVKTFFGNVVIYPLFPMLMQKIVKSFFKSPVFIITVGWTLSLSIGPLFGSLVGSAFDRLLFLTLNGRIIGLNLGLIVGAAACGYITAISLRSKIPEIQKWQILAIKLGWTGAIAVSDSLMYLLSIALGD